MAIKRLMGCTEIADAPFRSLVEVDRYLSQLKDELQDISSMLRTYQAQFARVERQPMVAADLSFKVGSDPKKSPKIISDKIDKIVVPKLNVLQNNFMIVDQLSDKIQELEALEANVSVNFKGARGQPDTIKAIRTMRAAYEVQYKKALDYLEDVGQKYAPTPLKELIKGVSEKLSEDLQYEKYKIAVYANEFTRPGPEKKPITEMMFTVYILLQNLTDDTGDIYPKFYIVFTCVLSPIGGDSTHLSVEQHVTVMHDFQSPAKFHPGRRVYNVKEAMTEIGNLLSLENISNAIGTLPHNLQSIDKDFFKAGAGEKIASVDVDPASFTFWFIKSVKKKDANALSASLYPQVKALIRNIRNAQLKMRPLESSGRLGVKFSIINLAKEGEINIHDVSWLKETFNLRDDQMRDIVKVVNKGDR